MSLDKYFEFRCWKGLKDRGLNDKEEYVQRLEYELEVITQMGFAGYFLIVSDFVSWANKNNIIVGPGRGSAASSLAVYSLGITAVDPLVYDLPFSRFMNKDRISMPDIDLDFDENRRADVIQYVTDKYGEEHVAHIGTLGTMKAKAAIRDVARTLELPIMATTALANLIPPPEHGKPVPLPKAIEKVKELSIKYKQKNTEGEVLRWAEKLENTVRSFGVHASGVAISPVPLTDLVPLAKGRGGEVTTQIEMNNLEEVGLIKFDFLGLRTLTIIQMTMDLIKKNRGISIDINNIPLDDEKTFENLRNGDTAGIFQMEGSSGIRDLLIKVGPKKLQDIAAIGAIYRPGPLGSDGLGPYLEARAGRAEPTYLFPELEPVLAETQGFMIFQEQVMRSCTHVCGWSDSEADTMRKAVGKKIQSLMDKLEPKFIADGQKHSGIPKNKMQQLWDMVVKFADYGFNKSHALCYGLIGYQTAYLKAHYPVEFMTSCLTCEYGNTDKIIRYIADCKRLNIEVLPPDINKSVADFSMQDGKIRFGLSAVKNLGKEPVSFITDERENGEYTSLLNFASRVNLSKINRRKLESLILVGAFDSLGENRASLLKSVDEIYTFKKELQKHEKKMITYKKRVGAYEQRNIDRALAKKEGVKVKAKLKEPVEPTFPEYPKIIKVVEMDMMDILSHEKELLGFYISGHPLDHYQSPDQQYLCIQDLYDFENKQMVRIAGVISSLEEKLTKKGKLMAFGQLEDATGRCDLVFWDSFYGKYKDILNSGVPVLLSGELEMDEHKKETGTGAKIKVYKARTLERKSLLFDPVEVTAPALKTQEMHELITKYHGDNQPIRVFFEAQDGSVFALNKVYWVDRSALGMFLSEIKNW